MLGTRLLTRSLHDSEKRLERGAEMVLLLGGQVWTPLALNRLPGPPNYICRRMALDRCWAATLPCVWGIG